MGMTEPQHTICIGGMGQALGELEVGTNATIRMVKLRLARICNAPAVCQMLVIGTVVLDDNSKIEDIVEFLEWPNLSLVLTDVAAYAQLESRGKGVDPVDIIEAIEGLADYVSCGDERCIQAFVDHLTHDNGLVRCASANALRKVASKTSSDQTLQQVTSSLCTCMEMSPDVASKSSAARALAGVAAHGDLLSTASLLRSFELVPLQASDALIQIAPKGHADTIRQLQSICSHKDAVLRAAAVRALGRLMLPTDKTSRSVLTRCVSDVSAEIREDAVKSAARNYPRGDGAMLGTLLSSLNDWSKGVRLAVLDGLGIVAPVGHSEAIESLCCSIREDSQDFRAVAVSSLVKIAPRHHREVFDLLKEEAQTGDKVAAAWLEQSVH